MADNINNAPPCWRMGNILSMKTDIAIIGAGPAGMLLAHLLAQEGINTLLLEQRDRAYAEARVRAGGLE